MIANNLFSSLQKIRPLPFLIDSAMIVLYFHDIEKMYKYGANKDINKLEYFEKILLQSGICFTKTEKNALHYVHGECLDYTSKKRTMNELAAFCHTVDTISARIWYAHGQRNQ